MNEFSINVTFEESAYILDALRYALFDWIKNFTKVDNNKILNVFDDKDVLLTLLTKEEMKNLKHFDYFKKLDLYLRLRKKVLGF